MHLLSDYSVNPHVLTTFILRPSFFTASMTWIIWTKRRAETISSPVLSTNFFLSTDYHYLFIIAKNVSGWVYEVVLGMLGYGFYATFKKNTKNKKHITS